MTSGKENHVPWVEFDDTECVALDKDFFRAAFDLAGSMRGRQTAYKHRISDELHGLLVQLNGVTRGSFEDCEKAHDILVRVAATAARNARLVAHLKAKKAGA